jgi:hypothetical protein
VNGPSSTWIAPEANQNFGPCCDIGSYTYRTTFDLTGLNPATAQISGQWTTDNGGLDILINEVSTGFTTPDSAFFSGFFAFAIDSGFEAGINTLDFVVNNGGGPHGLRVEITSATAGRAVVPEPVSVVLFGTGIAYVVARTRRRKKDQRA